MKRFLAATVILALTACAMPAMAYVAQITTSIDLASVRDEAQLRQALESAIEDVLNHAIAFEPTVVNLENTRILGGRIYILLLIADEDGEQLLKTLSSEGNRP